MNERTAAVVGAGITGLAAASSLQKKGWKVTLFERKDGPGGAVRSVRRDGWLAEYGPNTFQLKSRDTLNLFDRLGLSPHMVEAGSENATRYIVRNGRLVPLPASFPAFIRTRLFTRAGKLRLLKEPFIAAGADPDESVASFVRRRLGEEVLETAVNPFVSGIYAGTPETLSVRHAFPALYRLEQDHGSLLAGALKKGWKAARGKKDRFKTRLVSFDEGMEVLPRALAGSLKDIRYSAEVSRVHKSGNGWQLIVNGVKSSFFDVVLMNVPLYRVHESLVDGGGAIQEAAKHAGYPPLSVVLTGYRRGQVRHPLDGFGFLVPGTENRQILGSLFSSTLFPGRAPEHHVLITTFVGGARQPGLAGLPSDEIRRVVCSELEALLDTEGEPCFFDHAFWPDSIPQYGPDYDRVQEAIRKVEERNPGLRLIGNFRGGVAMPDCLNNGLEWAEKLSDERPGG